MTLNFILEKIKYVYNEVELDAIWIKHVSWYKRRGKNNSNILFENSLKIFKANLIKSKVNLKCFGISLKYKIMNSFISY